MLQRDIFLRAKKPVNFSYQWLTEELIELYWKKIGTPWITLGGVQIMTHQKCQQKEDWKKDAQNIIDVLEIFVIFAQIEIFYKK